jgi:hypothetical protein
MKQRPNIAVCPIGVQVGVPVTVPTLGNEQVIAVLHRVLHAGHPLSSLRRANSFQFQISPIQRAYPSQAPQPVIQHYCFPAESATTVPDSLTQSLLETK